MNRKIIARVELAEGCDMPVWPAPLLSSEPERRNSGNRRVPLQLVSEGEGARGGPTGKSLKRRANWPLQNRSIGVVNLGQRRSPGTILVSGLAAQPRRFGASHEVARIQRSRGHGSVVIMQNHVQQ